MSPQRHVPTVRVPYCNCNGGWGGEEVCYQGYVKGKSFVLSFQDSGDLNISDNFIVVTLHIEFKHVNHLAISNNSFTD